MNNFKIGDKVFPISKSGEYTSDIRAYRQSNRTIPVFLRDNGYLIVVNIIEFNGNIILSTPDYPNKNGDVFKAEDLILYEVKE